VLYRKVTGPLVLAPLIAAMFACPTQAQSLYMMSDLFVDDASGLVSMSATTSTDYSTNYYYLIRVTMGVWVTPQGGSQYYACNMGQETENQTSITITCSHNLGSQLALLDFLSTHEIDATYFGYQVIPWCTWDCPYYSDYYGFSLLGTGGTYSSNQYFYAPLMATPITQHTAKGDSIGLQAQRGCFYPTAENTTGFGWNPGNPYVAQFKQSLSGGNFANRIVLESFSGAAVDTCYRQNAYYGPVQNPEPSMFGSWPVGTIYRMTASGGLQVVGTNQQNQWGYDHVGFYGSPGTLRLNDYVNTMSSLPPGQNSCLVSFPQNLRMTCGSSAEQYYLLGSPLNIVVSASSSSASLSVTRSSATQLRLYP
jgi:hypothetical protein